MPRSPVRHLPEHYAEAEFLDVTDPRRLLWLNLMSLAPLAVAVVVIVVWGALSAPTRAGMADASVPWWAALPAFIGLLVLHEALHGIAMLALGHRPTFGAKLSQGLLYAISEGALYRRDEFVLIALLPLVAISVAGLGLMLVLPDTLAIWAGAAVILNAGSAIGDLWMTARALRYPRTALVRDEPTGVRFYLPQRAAGTHAADRPGGTPR